MATVLQEGRAIAPVDVSREALYVEDSWREPFFQLEEKVS